MELINSLIGLAGAIEELCSHPLVQAGFVVCVIIPASICIVIKAIIQRIKWF